MGLPGIPSSGQAGPQRGTVCMLPGSGWGPTSHIGPQGHLVVVDNPSRSRAPEVGPKAVVVHLRGAESALEARTSFTGDNQNIAHPPPRGTHPYNRGTQAHDAVCRPNLTCWMVGSPARLVRRLRMLRSDICRRAATGGMRDNMEGRRVTSAFMSLSSSSSWFRTAGWEGLRMEGWVCPPQLPYRLWPGRCLYIRHSTLPKVDTMGHPSPGSSTPGKPRIANWRDRVCKKTPPGSLLAEKSSRHSALGSLSGWPATPSDTRPLGPHTMAAGGDGAWPDLRV